MERLVKLVAGLSVAAGLWAAVEVAARLSQGPPPPSPHVIQISVAELVVDGGAHRLRHHLDPRQDVVVPAKGERPRVVTMGGSSVRHSWAQPPEVNWPLWLSRAVPGAEVVNLGSPGQTTLGLLALMDDVASLQPDLVVLYTGHNDWSEPVFQGRLATSRGWMLPVHGALSKSWVYAWLRGDAVSLAPPQPQRRRGVLVTDDRRALQWADQTLAAFTRQLGELVERSPAPVVLATLLRNADYPPTGLLADADQPGCAALPRTLPLSRPTEPGVLAQKVDTACGPDAALAHWYRALAAREAGDLDAAAAHFGESLRRDPLPLRAPLEADAAVRALAAENDAPLVDLAALLGPLPEGRLFDDTLHPSPLGARRIGELVAEVVADRLDLPPPGR